LSIPFENLIHLSLISPSKAMLATKYLMKMNYM